MNLSGLLPPIENLPAFRELANAARDQNTVSADVIESARAATLAALSRALTAPIVVLTARADRAKHFAEELAHWIERANVFLFPEPEPLFYERMVWSTETIAARLAALAALTNRPAPIIVTSTRAVMQRTIPPGDFRAGARVLRRGENVNLTELLSALVTLGYTFEAVVEMPGTFSRRGGILDVWTPMTMQPIRIELIGSEIESLRAFDSATQRSAHALDAITIVPASEALPGRGRDVIEKIAGWDLSACHPVAASALRADRDALDEGRRFAGIEFYLPDLYAHPASLADHLPQTGLLVVEDWSEVEATAQALEFQAEDVRADLEARREIPPGISAPHWSWNVLRDHLLARRRLLLDYASPGDSIQLPFTPGPRYGGQIKKILDDLMNARHDRASTIIVTRQAERISNLLRERDLFAKPVERVDDAPRPGEIILVHGAIAEGWTLKGEGTLRGMKDESNPSQLHPSSFILHILTDAELFGWSRPKPRRASKTRAASPETFFADLATGDPVVHIDHGIGIFRGLTRVAWNGPEREFLLIEYANQDQLYVPVHQIDRLSRYVAPGGREPTVHRLGTAEWSQVKERTRKAIADIADELLELYAAREVVPGHAFPPDDQWQHDLEASFPYVETEDQLTALDAIKSDMERARPMDRLVVGDVGYGKTEVALRAAFKAATNGKQVAVLVPTTVLAQQHYNTFSERLAAFPIQVEMLSRFRSDKEQNDIVEKISRGAVDIVIGTHRLLSPDVQFKDLGLLVIDEEQRFGVTHKERLKQLRQEVDVLTLTATPIPRTLYLSLSGARDMSTIETPPEDRLPIRTFVAEYDERLVRDAILRELDRGGQVFFVHNRVRGIHIIAEQIRKLVPEATVAVGHGQMNEEQLEQVMSEFAAGHYDVLVCTTIIESGIDIPNANTLIIHHADKFGLAQLYQLCGRVGRSAARAYAYLLHEKNHPLSEEARARLQSLAEASELGAGFQIAMRDLEIRGAGEILGARQSGHISAIGFDLYCRLLASAIESKKEKAKSEKSVEDFGYAPTIDLPMQAHIPEEYVPESGLRLKLYRRLADIRANAQVDEIARELTDRFGAPPEQVENLLYLLRLKVAAWHARLAAIAMDDGRVLIKFGREDANLVARLTARFKDRVRMTRDRAWVAGPESNLRWRQNLLDVVRAMSE